MKDYKEILILLKQYEKNSLIDTIKEPDINSSFIKEIFKNGNVKSYESIIKLSHPRMRTEVRNKDFDKYEQQFHTTINYMKLVHLANFYEKQINKYYLLMSRLHNKTMLNQGYEEILKSHLLDMKKDLEKPEKLYLSRILKPTIYDRKYEIKDTLNSRKKFKALQKEIKRQFAEDIKDFEEKLALQNTKKREHYIKEYFTLSDTTILNNKVNKLKSKYSSLREGYLNMKKEDLVSKYIKLMLTNNINIHESYKRLKYSFFTDIDSKAIVLNLQIPNFIDYPTIGSFKIIKKNLNSREELVDKALVNIALSSYILAYIKLFYEVDDKRNFDSLYINLFKGNNGDKIANMKCYSLLKVNLNEYNAIKKTKLEAPMYLEALIGKSITFDNLDEEVLPLQKGGI